LLTITPVRGTRPTAAGVQLDTRFRGSCPFGASPSGKPWCRRSAVLSGSTASRVRLASVNVVGTQPSPSSLQLDAERAGFETAAHT
jgi:hypothetical protein